MPAFVLVLRIGTVYAAGGDTCATSTVIPAVPYSDVSNTCGFNNSYDESCPSASSSSDAVYRYTPASNECVDILLCFGATTYDTKLYAYASDAGGCPPPGTGDSALDIACNDNGCVPQGPGRSQILGLPLSAAVTYYFVVDGSADACGAYRLDIIPCAGGACNGPQDCSDGNPCTQDNCNAGNCENPPKTEGTPCGSPADTDCDNPDTCDANGFCQPNLAINGIPCQDGLFCTVNDTCSNGNCSGLPRNCDDGIACTFDSCAEINGCVHNPLPGCCEVDTDCDDVNPCTDEICNLGTCEYTNNTTPCDDGLFCTVGDACSGGVCIGGAAGSCDDGDPCTSDVCDESEDVCSHSVIAGCCAVAADCDDGIGCTIDDCNAGTCTHTPASPGTPCGSTLSAQCTAADTCDASGACQLNHLPDGTTCDDRDACTDNDVCTNGFCRGTDNGICTAGGVNRLFDADTMRTTFQALLTENGQPVTQPVDLTFQFYDMSGVPVGAAIPQSGVPVVNGIVSTAIPIQEGVFTGSGRELGVTVNGGTELSPRLGVAAAPHAIRVDNVGNTELPDILELGDATHMGNLRLVRPAFSASSATARGPFTMVGVAEWGIENLSLSNDCGGDIECETYTHYDPVGRGRIKLRACASDDTNASSEEEAQINLYDQDGTHRVRISSGADPCGSGSANDARMALLNRTGTSPAVQLQASESGEDGAQITLRNAAEEITVEIDADQNDDAAMNIKSYSSGLDRLKDAIRLDSDNEFGPEISLWDAAGTNESVEIRGSADATDNTGSGSIKIRRNGNMAVRIDSGKNGGGRLAMRPEGASSSSIELYADYDGSGNSYIGTHYLEIKGGCDLSERFGIKGQPEQIRPGTVVCIDPDHAGELVVCDKAYDHRAAGIISGAGGIRPGMMMSQYDLAGDGDHPVALTGRVYVWADASTNGPIEPGDLLTTSERRGHAMKVADHGKALGAILGKAMTPLEQGQGLVLVLVSLQ